MQQRLCGQPETHTGPNGISDARHGPKASIKARAFCYDGDMMPRVTPQRQIFASYRHKNETSGGVQGISVFEDSLHITWTALESSGQNWIVNTIGPESKWYVAGP